MGLDRYGPGQVQVQTLDTSASLGLLPHGRWGECHICCPETPQANCQGLKRTMLVKNELPEEEVSPCCFEFTCEFKFTGSLSDKEQGKGGKGNPEAFETF